MANYNPVGGFNNNGGYPFYNNQYQNPQPNYYNQFNNPNPFNPINPNPNLNNTGITQNQYAYVNGIEGAKSFQVSPGRTMLLIDNDNPFVYFKTANELGQSSLRYFTIKELDENKAKEIITGAPKQETKINTEDFVLKSDFKELLDKYDNLSKKLEKLAKTTNKEA